MLLLLYQMIFVLRSCIYMYVYQIGIGYESSWFHCTVPRLYLCYQDARHRVDRRCCQDNCPRCKPLHNDDVMMISDDHRMLISVVNRELNMYTKED